MKNPEMLRWLYNIDFIRLLFVVLIVYYHLLKRSYVPDNHIAFSTYIKENSLSIGYCS